MSTQHDADKQMMQRIAMGLDLISAAIKDRYGSEDETPAQQVIRERVENNEPVGLGRRVDVSVQPDVTQGPLSSSYGAQTWYPHGHPMNDSGSSAFPPAGNDGK